jgi:hypothetical protein
MAGGCRNKAVRRLSHSNQGRGTYRIFAEAIQCCVARLGAAMAEIANFTLKYSGALADDSRLDFYDVSQALIGFQRSLALTTHLVLTGEIITQAPSLDKAQIFLDTPEPGSWKITAIIVTRYIA